MRLAEPPRPVMLKYRIQNIDPAKDLVNLDERVARLPEWRRRVARSFANPLDRLQSAMAYELLVDLLSDLYGHESGPLTLEYDVNGKPLLAGRPDLFVSLSHCARGVMAVIGDIPVGCDIEVIRRPYAGNCDDIAGYCFSEAECSLIGQAADRSEKFTRIWTEKEALFKLDNTLELEHLDTTRILHAEIRSVTTHDYIATMAWTERFQPCGAIDR